jgi:hypothetical protein
MKLDGSMLDMENDIQGVVNKLGIEATLQALKGFGGVLLLLLMRLLCYI